MILVAKGLCEKDIQELIDGMGLENVEVMENPDTIDRNDKTQIHADICYDMHQTYIEKNARYGDSFSKQFSEFGLQSTIIRLTDKLERLKTLSKNPQMDTLDESICDTLMDLANYAIMTLVEIEKNESRG